MKGYRTVDLKVLRELIRYDEATGNLIWKKRPRRFFSSEKSCRTWNTCFSGRVAGTPDAYGYRKVSVTNVALFSHRVVWALVRGEWPRDQIDHINGNKSDNRISNLRLATTSQNHCNTPPPKTNTSGVKGATWCKQTNRWSAAIMLNKRNIHVGRFHTLEEASEALKAAREKHHGEFSRHI